MLYQRKSFTVPASAGNAAYCAEHGHTMPDVRGKCVRCGQPYSRADYFADALGMERVDWEEAARAQRCVS